MEERLVLLRKKGDKLIKCNLKGAASSLSGSFC